MRESVYSNQVLLPCLDAASWLAALGISPAWQAILAQTEAPGAAQAWWYGSIAATVVTTLASFNVSGSSSAGTGLLALSWGTDFSSANYVVIGNARTSIGPRIVYPSAQTASGASFERADPASGTLFDGPFSIVAYGDQV